MEDSLRCALAEARFEMVANSSVDICVDSYFSVSNARCCLSDVASPRLGPDVRFEVRFCGFSGVDVGIGVRAEPG
jgi:hypothetical protein